MAKQMFVYHFEIVDRGKMASAQEIVFTWRWCMNSFILCQFGGYRQVTILGNLRLDLVVKYIFRQVVVYFHNPAYYLR